MLFEIGDIMYQSDHQHISGDYIGAVNERKIGVCYIAVQKSGLEYLHGVLDLLMQKLFKGKVNYKLL